MSKSYKQIENIINIDPENTFFTNEKYGKEISDIRDNAAVGLFLKHEQNMLALDLKIYNDTIKMDGYILLNEEKDSTSTYFKIMPYLISLPKNICIDNTEIQHKDNPPTVKMRLNKMY